MIKVTSFCELKAGKSRLKANSYIIFHNFDSDSSLGDYEFSTFCQLLVGKQWSFSEIFVEKATNTSLFLMRESQHSYGAQSLVDLH